MSPFHYKVENRKVGQDRGCATDPTGTLPSHLECALGPIDPFLKIVENLLLPLFLPQAFYATEKYWEDKNPWYSSRNLNFPTKDNIILS